ncbi:MAG: protein translocase subunit SecF [Desulfobacteraceae bacterium]|nr:protein translocase subunit SecF [Desulfobacteraceae bacterium]
MKDQKYKNEDDFINALNKTIGADKADQYKSWILRHTRANEELSANIKSALKTATGNEPDIRSVNMVGPQVSRDLKRKALLAMFCALLFITIYISGRFESQWLKSGGMVVGLLFCVFSLSSFNISMPVLIFAALIITLILFWFLKLKYAMGAIVAIIHDVSITVGVFSIFNKEFDLPIIAALLTIIGYSLNDTIIVYDRIRENRRKHHKNPLDFILNKSINETLNRTMLTSITTLVVVMSLFILGGGVIHDFAFALIVGIVIGTYSSVYVASPILLSWHEFEKKKSGIS